MFKKTISIFIIFIFSLSSIQPQARSQSMPVELSAPGTMVNLSPAFEPALIKGLTIHKDNPFLFDFIVDTGNSGLSTDSLQLKAEADRLIKYFFACLTIPEKDLWVNLSPYEKNRIVPQALGTTALGRDLLAEDYILKQLTASLIYPEKNLGKTFWNRVYTKAQQMYGTTQIPVNTFNKVWIVADTASVYEHGQTAFVVSGHLKVMLEEDYLSLQKHSSPVPPLSYKEGARGSYNDTHSIASQIVRQIILPEIEKEVNQGKNFATLRQIFNSLILASWYKKNLKEALLNQVYTDKNITSGVIVSRAKQSREKIYQQYLIAYKKGVFNYIKEDTQPDGQAIPRKYFSGGFVADELNIRNASLAMVIPASKPTGSNFALRVVLTTTETPNAAMNAVEGVGDLNPSEWDGFIERLMESGLINMPQGGLPSFDDVKVIQAVVLRKNGHNFKVVREDVVEGDPTNPPLYSSATIRYNLPIVKYYLLSDYLNKLITKEAIAHDNTINQIRTTSLRLVVNIFPLLRGNAGKIASMLVLRDQLSNLKEQLNLILRKWGEIKPRIAELLRNPPTPDWTRDHYGDSAPALQEATIIMNEHVVLSRNLQRDLDSWEQGVNSLEQELNGSRAMTSPDEIQPITSAPNVGEKPKTLPDDKRQRTTGGPDFKPASAAAAQKDKWEVADDSGVKPMLSEFFNDGKTMAESRILTMKNGDKKSKLRLELIVGKVHIFKDGVQQGKPRDDAGLIGDHSYNIIGEFYDNPAMVVFFSNDSLLNIESAENGPIITSVSNISLPDLLGLDQRFIASEGFVEGSMETASKGLRVKQTVNDFIRITLGADTPQGTDKTLDTTKIRNIEYADRRIQGLNNSLMISMNRVNHHPIFGDDSVRNEIESRMANDHSAIQALVDWIAEHPVQALSRLMHLSMTYSLDRTREDNLNEDRHLLREILIRAGFDDSDPTSSKIKRDFISAAMTVDVTRDNDEIGPGRLIDVSIDDKPYRISFRKKSDGDIVVQIEDANGLRSLLPYMFYKENLFVGPRPEDRGPNPARDAMDIVEASGILSSARAQYLFNLGANKDTGINIIIGKITDQRRVKEGSLNQEDFNALIELMSSNIKELSRVRQNVADIFSHDDIIRILTAEQREALVNFLRIRMLEPKELNYKVHLKIIDLLIKLKSFDVLVSILINFQKKQISKKEIVDALLRHLDRVLDLKTSDGTLFNELISYCRVDIPDINLKPKLIQLLQALQTGSFSAAMTSKDDIDLTKIPAMLQELDELSAQLDRDIREVGPNPEKIEDQIWLSKLTVYKSKILRFKLGISEHGEGIPKEVLEILKLAHALCQKKQITVQVLEELYETGIGQEEESPELNDILNDLITAWKSEIPSRKKALARLKTILSTVGDEPDQEFHDAQIQTFNAQWQASKAMMHDATPPNNTALTITPGGIDLNTANMGMTVTKDANGGVKVNFDPAMIARIKEEGIKSAVPIIIGVTPMADSDIRPLLGLAPA